MAFWKQVGRILNAGQTRSLLLTGAVNDLYDNGDSEYVPLVDLLQSKWGESGHIIVTYELSGPIRFQTEQDREVMKAAWIKWRTGMDSEQLAIKKMVATQKVKSELDLIEDTFDQNLIKAIGRPTVALALLRQFCMCSRAKVEEKPVLEKNMIIILENADMIIPNAPITQLSDGDRNRVGMCQAWFSEPEFNRNHDSVILISESRSLLNNRVASLPQMLEVEVTSPDYQMRLNFIQWFNKEHKEVKSWGSIEQLAQLTAGLSIHALNQLLKGAVYGDGEITRDMVVDKVEDFIKSELGGDIVEFKKPEHCLKDVIGFTALKQFLDDELIPRFEASGQDALPGAAVCGPIGGGKTFIFEAVAAELDMVVLVLKNIRSQWFGQTDVIFERLRRVLNALSKVVIFVDEADTQFGGVGKDSHSTERRLTGKIQAMMSDPTLRGKVIWLLMTARIQLLSPDIRRPGRVGDLIIPVLDPQGEDREDFLEWMLTGAGVTELTDEQLNKLKSVTAGYFSAAYAAVRSELKSRSRSDKLDFDKVMAIIDDHIAPNIGKARRYQSLQAMVNCTRKSLLPNYTTIEREAWLEEIKLLEMQGVS